MQVDRQTQATAPAPLALHHMSWKMRIFLFFLIALIGLFAFGATMVAKTGLIRVPMFSNLVSAVGQPSRMVAIPAATPTVQETFRTQFEGAIARYARSRAEADRAVQIRVAESSITKSLLAELPNLQGKFGDAEVKYAQVAIEPEAVELFVKLSRDGRENTLNVAFVVDIQEGRPVFVVKHIRLGTLGIPSFAANLVTNIFGEQGMDEIVEGLRSSLVLDEIEYRRGLMIVNATLATGTANGR